MKAFLWVVLLGFLGLCGYYYFKAFIIPDESRMIGIAFAQPTEDTMELHIQLTMLLAAEDTYPYLTDAGVDWPRWAKDHYIVKDEVGNQVEFKKRMRSSIITENDTYGLGEGFLIGPVEPGQAYTFKYIPVVGEPEEFEYEFTAPTEEQTRLRVTFKPL